MTRAIISECWMPKGCGRRGSYSTSAYIAVSQPLKLGVAKSGTLRLVSLSFKNICTRLPEYWTSNLLVTWGGLAKHQAMQLESVSGNRSARHKIGRASCRERG